MPKVENYNVKEYIASSWAYLMASLWLLQLSGLFIYDVFIFSFLSLPVDVLRHSISLFLFLNLASPWYPGCQCSSSGIWYYIKLALPHVIKCNLLMTSPLPSQRLHIIAQLLNAYLCRYYMTISCYILLIAINDFRGDLMIKNAAKAG